MTDAPELLPCPFCGENPILDKWTDGDPSGGDDIEIGEVVCPYCNASGPDAPVSHAVAVWNTRANDI